MKSLFVAVVLSLFAGVAVACDCACGCQESGVCSCPDCGCPHKAEKRVALPNDSGKLYLSIYVKNDAQIKSLYAKHPEMKSYKSRCHVNVYRASDPMTKSRFGTVKTPSAFVQTASGSVVWASGPLDRLCIFNKNKKDNDEKPPVDDQVDDQEDEEIDEAPEPQGLGPIAVVACVFGGLALGVGSKFVQEVRG